MRDVTIGTAQRSCVGERVCGDAFAVWSEDGRTTVAVADGLGHGPLAAEAAEAFCAHAEENGASALEEIMRTAQARLAGTRGVAAALLRIDDRDGFVEYAGVGNIELVAESRVPIRPVSMPGIVGQRVRKITPFRYDMDGGAIIAVFSDGISSRWELSAYKGLEPQEIAEAILHDHGKTHDDATCVVVRY